MLPPKRKHSSGNRSWLSGYLLTNSYFALDHNSRYPLSATHIKPMVHYPGRACKSLPSVERVHPFTADPLYFPESRITGDASEIVRNAHGKTHVFDRQTVCRIVVVRMQAGRIYSGYKTTLRRSLRVVWRGRGKRGITSLSRYRSTFSFSRCRKQSLYFVSCVVQT